MDDHLIVLGRVEGKVDLIIDHLAGHDVKIAALQKRVWGITAAGAFGAFLLANVEKVKHLFS